MYIVMKSLMKCNIRSVCCTFAVAKIKVW